MREREIAIPDEIARISFLTNRCLLNIQRDAKEEALGVIRKATEGMLYNVARQKKYITDIKARGLEEYLKVFNGKEECLPTSIRNHIQVIQKYCNPALHYQANDSISDETSLKNSLSALNEIVKWYISFYTISDTKCLRGAVRALITTADSLRTDNNYEYEEDDQPEERKAILDRIFEKAKMDNISAMLYSARIYKQGYLGISRNLNRALKLFEKCVSIAEDDRIRSIALDEMSGIAYSQHDYPRSFNYALQSAELNNPRIMTHLAFLYNRGIGTEQNKIAAKKWYNKAAQSNTPNASMACHDLVRFYRHSVSNREIFELLKQSASLNHVESCYELGMAYFWGIYGLPKDLIEASQWLELAADQGSADAMHELGCLYYWGSPDFPVDYTRAKYWCEKALKLKHPLAASLLAYLYDHGFLGDPDYQKAKALYKFAADSGHLFSQYDYGLLCLMDTQHTRPDYSQAKFYLEKAAEQNYLLANCFLAEMAYFGLGQTPKRSEAHMRFERAKAGGDFWPDIIRDALS